MNSDRCSQCLIPTAKKLLFSVTLFSVSWLGKTDSVWRALGGDPQALLFILVFLKTKSYGHKFKGQFSNNMIDPKGKSQVNDVLLSFLTAQRWVSFRSLFLKF